jgi:uncharacterized protein YkwD
LQKLSPSAQGDARVFVDRTFVDARQAPVQSSLAVAPIVRVMPPTRREFLLAALGPWPLVRLGQDRAAGRARDRDVRIEERIFRLTNQQRHGRRLLVFESLAALSDIARAHSLDMLTRDYFDHRSPEGLHSADRIAKHGLSFDATGENLYMVRNGATDADRLAESIVTGWMNSRAHRENILEADYRFLGVGVATAGRVVIATQLFAG